MGVRAHCPLHMKQSIMDAFRLASHLAASTSSQLNDSFALILRPGAVAIACLAAVPFENTVNPHTFFTAHMHEIPLGSGRH